MGQSRRLHEQRVERLPSRNARSRVIWTGNRRRAWANEGAFNTTAAAHKLAISIVYTR